MVEALWTDVAQAYARSFAGLCAGATGSLLEDLPAGARLLDVGCGTGSLVAAARLAGHDAIGVDPDPEMTALASSLLGDATGDAVVDGGLPDLPFADDGFEVVIASFVLNHVDHPRRGALELARVAAPGGVVRATIWGRTPPPQAVLWNALLDRAGAERAPVPRLAADLDFQRSPAGLAEILAGAGLAVTRAGTLGWTWRIAPDDLWAGLTAVGSFGVLWRAQSDAVRARLRGAYDELGEPWREGGLFTFDVECVSVEARVPRS